MKMIAEKMLQCPDCAMNSFDLIIQRLIQGSYVAVLVCYFIILYFIINSYMYLLLVSIALEGYDKIFNYIVCHIIFKQPDIIAISLMDKYSSRGVCKLTIGKEKLRWHHMFYGVSKTSPYKEEINREYNFISLISI